MMRSDLCVQSYDIFYNKSFLWRENNERLAKVRAFFSFIIDMYVLVVGCKMLVHFKICLLFAKYFIK